MRLKRANEIIAELGADVCKEAYRLNTVDGEGPNAVSMYLGLTWGKANSAITAHATILDHARKAAEKCAK